MRSAKWEKTGRPGGFPVATFCRSCSDVARCAYLFVGRCSRADIPTPPNKRRFGTTETSGTGEWRMEGEAIGSKVRKARKRWISGWGPLLLVFRGVPSGSTGVRQVPACPYSHSSSHRSYIPPANQYQAFRMHRKFGYLEGMSTGGNERSVSAKTTQKGGFGGVIPSCWCSVGFRQVPWGAASCRGGPARLSPHCTWYLGAPPSAAVVHCDYWPFSSPLCPARRPKTGVTKPPQHCVSGRADERGKREGRKFKKPRKMVD